MLTKLKEYKELIAIVVFFLGGFFWMQNQFPTRADLRAEVRVLNCLLDKYMLLTQLQIRGRDLERQVADLTSQIALYGDDQDKKLPPVSPAMRQERESKREELEEVRRDLKANVAEIKKTGDELARNICGGVS